MCPQQIKKIKTLINTHTHTHGHSHACTHTMHARTHARTHPGTLHNTLWHRIHACIIKLTNHHTHTHTHSHWHTVQHTVTPNTSITLTPTNRYIYIYIHMSVCACTQTHTHAHAHAHSKCDWSAHGSWHHSDQFWFLLLPTPKPLPMLHTHSCLLPSLKVNQLFSFHLFSFLFSFYNSFPPPPPPTPLFFLLFFVVKLLDVDWTAMESMSTWSVFIATHQPFLCTHIPHCWWFYLSGPSHILLLFVGFSFVCFFVCVLFLFFDKPGAGPTSTMNTMLLVKTFLYQGRQIHRLNLI